ncbi:hypothetical protein D3C85_1496200 [compost metagenome]
MILNKKADDPTFRKGIDDLPTDSLILSEKWKKIFLVKPIPKTIGWFLVLESNILCQCSSRHKPKCLPTGISDCNLANGYSGFKRLRMNLMWNTDKEYMAGLRYIVKKNVGITTHYDSDMGLGFGVSLNY